MEMTIPSVSELQDLHTRLKRFTDGFADCFVRPSTRKHLQTYIAGQTSALERKSVEPMALAAGMPPRTLQEFLSLSRWDHDKMRSRVLQHVVHQHASPAAIALLDETAFPKKGEKTAGVQRQYCGAKGRTENCVVAVYLGYATEQFHALVDCALFVPEEHWAEDLPRRRAAGIPDALQFQTKPQIALELLRRTQASGAAFKYLTADEWYGSSSAFRSGVAALGITYVVEVNPTVCGWTQQPASACPGVHAGTARVERAWRCGGPSWNAFHIKDTEKGPVVWEVRAGRFWPSYNGQCLPEGWRLQMRHALTGERKYFLSNAALDTPLEVLLHVAFSRAEIEQLFEAAKGEIGLDHFEVRNYLPLLRQLIVSLASLLFLAEQTTRLREKKRLVESLPGQKSGRSAA